MLSEEESERVRKAVEKAEADLTAEIVACVLERSSPYPETVWGGAAAGAALASAALFLVDVASPLWLSVSTMILAVPAAGLLGAALGKWCRPLQRLIIGDRRMSASVDRRAKEAFFDHGLAGTARRESVLIFASLLEHRVVVLADQGVRAKVAAQAWEDAVQAMRSRAAEGRVADGLVAAVESVERALRAAGFAGAGGGELGDAPITGR